jgi:hypothetical protein
VKNKRHLQTSSPDDTQQNKILKKSKKGKMICGWTAGKNRKQLKLNICTINFVNVVK